MACIVLFDKIIPGKTQFFWNMDNKTETQKHRSALSQNDVKAI